MTSDALVGTAASMTSPVEPSIETASPSRMTLPATFIVLALALMSRAPQPTTEGLPIWRPTTAACDVMPPVAVRMPWATDMPWMSSGTVSIRTSRTFLPFCAQATASSAVKTTAPVAAPGEAGRPFAATGTDRRALGSKIGCSSWSSACGSTFRRASFLVRTPSSHMSTAICTAASPVRLPLRVWSMYRVFSWMVNSKSCTSL